MLPNYHVEVLEYQDYTDDFKGITKSKPHIIFDNPELAPLAQILNWQFPDVDRLRNTQNFLLRPWHPAVTERTFRVEENSYLSLNKQGTARVFQFSDFPEDYKEIQLDPQLVIQVYIEAIRLADEMKVF